MYTLVHYMYIYFTKRNDSLKKKIEKNKNDKIINNNYIDQKIKKHHLFLQ